ncbi:hypothetical protein PPL_03284 [Heterostelium album PN500]|uniref:Complex 1 LYR protein domain-containing protein n=1 Tax=Heterostelium pallidum (strain ATCC 26659 / Pp 5 / PN500) TaxID=670386 RepID=D3B4G0_HETP5|nr:hypothetical protein PPL_03284 [Heterostelium album PN500]EFA84208.1 hypothetical protein PPL_03284 [Heterostelium album PN500]|eukprot:XP_020436324.1 hypothetical protein PPL_03284 [Heterostelium album PN500]
MYSGIEHKTKERLKMPTENRRQFVLHKTRQEFRDSRNETDPKKIKSLLIIGNTHLDTVMIQAKHLATILEYEPTATEIAHHERSSNANQPLQSPNDQKTLLINNQYIEQERKREQNEKIRIQRENNEDNIK